MKRLFFAVVLAGILIAGAAAAANAQLYRDYCNWPYYTPYAGWNPNFVHTSSFTYKVTGSDAVRSGFMIRPIGSPYWDMPLRQGSSSLVEVQIF